MSCQYFLLIIIMSCFARLLRVSLLSYLVKSTLFTMKRTKRSGRKYRIDQLDIKVNYI